MLNKRFVVITEEIDGELYEVEGCALAVEDDRQYADACKNPWKYLAGAIRKVVDKFVNIYRYTLVEEIECSVREIEIVREMFPEPEYYEIVYKDGIARVYRISVLDRFCNTISKFNLHKRLSWLEPYVLQWQLDEVNDTLTSPDNKFMLKAVVA